MSRSLKKGPFVDPKLMKKVLAAKSGSGIVIKTWSRASEIAPEMVGHIFGVHNGRTHIEVRVTEEMVGHRLGEFSLTRKFTRHGGKMQKELEVKASAPAKTSASAAKPAAKKK
jgi:small subunit ribosomal protein S19